MVPTMSQDEIKGKAVSQRGRVEQELTNHLYRETLGASQASPFDLPQVVRASVVKFILTREAPLQAVVEAARVLVEHALAGDEKRIADGGYNVREDFDRLAAALTKVPRP